MSNPGELRQIPSGYSPGIEPTPKLPLNATAVGTGDPSRQTLAGTADPRVPLLNLSTVHVRMDSLQRFLTESVNQNTLISQDQMAMVSTEIVSAIHQIIVNGAALLACSQQLPAVDLTAPAAGKLSDLAIPRAVISSTANGKVTDQSPSIAEKASSEPLDLKVESLDVDVKDEIEDHDDGCEIVELDSVELLAEHIHFCEICGKGFKRDANLRMHMRAHGNQYKTPEALARPEKCVEPRRRTVFSCPFQGCNRNRCHKKFKALKSVICVRNHFKRSHCPKMYSCNRCNKKSFSVLADLKSHLKHCGEAKWRCSCGTSFSRKDKLFGHMALFEGHMPAVADEDEKSKGVVAMEEDEEEETVVKERERELGPNCSDNAFFEGLLDGFASFESYCLHDVLGSSPAGVVDQFYGL
ncbi:hypothetical protein L1049_002979 [Liquidambar formosana]|uniref:C2H2-type domain-containing protein n=1 Tax=Liquidambar formosana TaxID=63359 RepID=A0AAP0NGT0_LIQFO